MTAVHAGGFVAGNPVHCQCGAVVGTSDHWSRWTVTQSGPCPDWHSAKSDPLVRLSAVLALLDAEAVAYESEPPGSVAAGVFAEASQLVAKTLGVDR